MYLKTIVMKSTDLFKRELILEVATDGQRRMIYRTVSATGDALYLEESELEDHTRPVSEDSDFNVFFTEWSFWRSFVEYTSLEGLKNRHVWHQPANEWLGLTPVFIHEDLCPLVRKSVAEASRELHADARQWEGMRVWLQHLSGLSTANETIVEPSKIYRHAV
jgi:hypothetical protein